MALAKDKRTPAEINRRAILSAVPVAGLAAALSAGAPVDAGHSAERPAQVEAIQIEDLPFVRSATRSERKNGMNPRVFWSVAATGDYIMDCDTGARYARLAIRYMNAESFGALLGWIALDMQRFAPDYTGIEIGFWAEIGRNTVLLYPPMPSMGRVKP